MTDWYGFQMEEFVYAGRQARVVFPREGTCNGRLLLKTEYWGAFPATELALLEQGFHLCCIRNDNRWGTDSVLDAQAQLVMHLCEKYGLCARVVPVGMSCGGLIAVKFAAKYPELVSCMYLDAPLIDYRSLGDKPTLDEALRILGYAEPVDLDHESGMALFQLPELVKSRIPVILVAGDSDPVVPFAANGAVLQQLYKENGIDISVHLKPGCAHHPHGLGDPKPVVDFLVSH